MHVKPPACLVSQHTDSPASPAARMHLHTTVPIAENYRGICRKLCILQDEARRLAEQVHGLEDARNRWNAELAAREAGVSSKEEALAADVRQKDADQRRRLAQDQQVRAMMLHADRSQAVAYIEIGTQSRVPLCVLRDSMQMCSCIFLHLASAQLCV